MFLGNPAKEQEKLNVAHHVDSLFISHSVDNRHHRPYVDRSNYHLRDHKIALLDKELHIFERNEVLPFLMKRFDLCEWLVELLEIDFVLCDQLVHLLIVAVVLTKQLPIEALSIRVDFLLEQSVDSNCVVFDFSFLHVNEDCTAHDELHKFIPIEVILSTFLEVV